MTGGLRCEALGLMVTMLADYAYRVKRLVHRGLTSEVISHIARFTQAFCVVFHVLRSTTDARNILDDGHSHMTAS